MPHTLQKNNHKNTRPSQQEAQEAVKTLLRWIGEDASREGLQQTPKRVVKAWQEYSTGYDKDPVSLLQQTFSEIQDYNEFILLRDIRFESHCEHHLAPIIGYAHVAYLPQKRVVGISKLARLVDIFAKRLQIQERMTAQIADAIQEALNPRGVFVMIDAVHECMTARGVHKPGVSMVTQATRGVFQDDERCRRELKDLLKTCK